MLTCLCLHPKTLRYWSGGRHAYWLMYSLVPCPVPCQWFRARLGKMSYTRQKLTCHSGVLPPCSQDLQQFGCKNKMDYVAASFVQVLCNMPGSGHVAVLAPTRHLFGLSHMSCNNNAFSLHSMLMT
jgi:hypothetical protein